MAGDWNSPITSSPLSSTPKRDPMSRRNSETRIVLQLDPRVALEAIILNRLERTPTGRRHEWLRNLLLVGFRIECQVLQGSTQSRDTLTPTRNFTWNPRTLKPADPSESLKPADVASTRTTPIVNTKPFAMLARVIGHDASARQALSR